MLLYPLVVSCISGITIIIHIIPKLIWQQVATLTFVNKFMSICGDLKLAAEMRLPGLYLNEY